MSKLINTFNVLLKYLVNSALLLKLTILIMPRCQRKSREEHGKRKKMDTGKERKQSQIGHRCILWVRNVITWSGGIIIS